MTNPHIRPSRRAPCHASHPSHVRPTRPVPRHHLRVVRRVRHELQVDQVRGGQTEAQELGQALLEGHEAFLLHVLNHVCVAGRCRCGRSRRNRFRQKGMRKETDRVSDKEISKKELA